MSQTCTKNKGERVRFKAYRGIFRTPVIRNILDKLLHIDEYENIDQNLWKCGV